MMRRSIFRRLERLSRMFLNGASQLCWEIKSIAQRTLSRHIRASRGHILSNHATTIRRSICHTWDSA